MTDETICRAVMDGSPYPVLFVDTNHTIRYMNRAARYHYCTERGHPDLVGKSVFDCHREPAWREKLEHIVEGFRHDAKEVFLKVNDRNLRIYVTPVLGEDGKFMGYYERYEMNLCLTPHDNKRL